ncbi:MAG: hypothetical protein HY980_00825 [Candidatus Magasanikbacteria bacterium]|nr:hypothetical protein [Candidatus Magasanikbacteria bacterium]
MPLQNTSNKWTMSPVGRGAIPTASVSNKQQPVSSISRINSSSSVRTSVSGPSLPPVGMDHLGAGNGREAMDDARYGYVRGLIRKRQEKEAKSGETSTKSDVSSSKPTAPSKFKLKLGTGVTFSRSLPRGGFERTMRHMRLRDYKTTFRNLSKDNVRFIGDLIERHATHRATGSGYGRASHKEMMKEVEQARREGKISYADKSDFKKIIEQLE